MKLLVDARIGWTSGIGRYAANVVPRVAAAFPDIQFHLLVADEDLTAAEDAVAMLPNVKVEHSDIRPFSLREQVELPRMARSFDLTWFTNYWVPLAWSGRYIVTVHDIIHLMPEYFPASPLKRALARRTFAKIARGAAAISFVSRFTRRSFEAEFGAPRLGAVQYNGIDHRDWRLFDPENPPVKTRRLLTVGASKKHKNFDMLADAWRNADIPAGWRLTIVSPAAQLRSSVDVEHIFAGVDGVDIRRGVTNSELHDLYGEAAIILMPSRYEGFGLPLLEGMQSGALCISSTAEALVEIGEGGFAQFVNPDDAPGWALAIGRACAMVDAGAPYLRAIQAHNMIHAASFSWDRCGREMAALLKQLL